MSLTISVVIPARNEASRINASLTSILDQEPKVHQVIVVDDASTDGTAEIARARGAIVLRLSRRGGDATARNAGARLATGDVLAFVDADDRVLPGWSAGLLDAFGAGADVVAGAIEIEPPKTRAQTVGLRAFPGHDLVGRNGFLPAASTANLAFRPAVFDAIGGFDETLRLVDDTDLSFRLGLAGFNITYAPEARVLYTLRGSYRALLRQAATRAFWAASLRHKYARYVFFPAIRASDRRRLWLDVLTGMGMVVTSRKWDAALNAWARAGVVAARRVGRRLGYLHYRLRLRPRAVALEPSTPETAHTATPLVAEPRALLAGADRDGIAMIARALRADPAIASQPPVVPPQVVARWDESPVDFAELTRLARSFGWRLDEDLALRRLAWEDPKTWGQSWLALHGIGAWLQRKPGFVMGAVGAVDVLRERLPGIPLLVVNRHDRGDHASDAVYISTAMLIEDASSAVAVLTPFLGLVRPEEVAAAFDLLMLRHRWTRAFHKPRF